ncbi:MAG: hypothetical protein ACLPN5_11110 [Roseiarcus sp.]
MRRVDKRTENTLHPAAMLLLELLITPLIMGSATFASRRWGDVVGGWLVGLPVVSGPVSVYLLVERGPDFAARAAADSLSGVMAQAGFCIGYALGAQRGVAAALISATFGFLALGGAAVALAPPLAALMAGAAAMLALARVLLPADGAAAARLPAPRWDLPARLVIVTTLVVTVTGFAGALGPQLSGLAATYPVIGGAIAAFAQLARGPKAGIAALRGMATALYGFIAFFAVIGFTLGPLAPLTAYGAALAAALAIQGLTLRGLESGARAQGCIQPPGRCSSPPGPP